MVLKQLVGHLSWTRATIERRVNLYFTDIPKVRNEVEAISFTMEVLIQTTLRWTCADIAVNAPFENCVTISNGNQAYTVYLFQNNAQTLLEAYSSCYKAV